MNRNRLLPLLCVGAALGLLMALAHPSLATEDRSDESYKTYGAAEARKVVQAPERWITADHSKHEALKKTFDKPEQVTQACLSCHNEASLQIHETIHWTWLCPADSSQRMGKGGLTLNNF